MWSTPFPVNLFNGDQRWLGARIGSGSELSPRRRIVTAAFAYHSLQADSAGTAVTVAPNGVTSTSLVDGAVNSQKIQDLTIAAADIAGSTITGEKIAANAIISSRVLDGSLLGVDIAASQITTSHVVNGSLLGADFVAGSITGTQIADGSLSAADVVPNSLTGDEIEDMSIHTTDLSDGLITSLQIADGTINSNDLGANSVGASEIQANAVSADETLDEPGVAQALNGAVAGIDLVDTSPVNLLTRSINCPAGGYVLAIASCSVFLDWGNSRRPLLAVSDVSESLPSDVTVVISKGALSEFSGEIPVSTQRIFAVTSGSNTFYLVGRLSDNWPGEVNVSEMMLSLIYLPSAYGTVSGGIPPSRTDQQTGNEPTQPGEGDTKD
ncbi:MAG: hypothetical protein IPH59_05205 [bacterium]|nr:hypothetical protein [bacterium]